MLSLLVILNRYQIAKSMEQMHPDNVNIDVIHSLPDTTKYIKGSRLRFKGLGEKNSIINSFFLDFLKGYNLPVLFRERVDANKIAFHPHTPLPVIIRVINYTDQKMAHTFSLEYGTPLSTPVLLHFLHREPIVFLSESQLISFNVLPVQHLRSINRLAGKTNAVLKSFFERRNLVLCEFICSFGIVDEKIAVIGDFLSPSLQVASVTNGSLPKPLTVSGTRELKMYTEQLLDFIKV